MIIDMHIHCFPDSLAPRAVSTLASNAGLSVYTDGTLGNLKGSMHNAGIDICVLQPIATKPEQTIGVNRWAVDVQDENIISFGTIHPDFPDWKAEVKWLVSTGIKGVKFHPDYQNFFVDEPRLFPIYEALYEAGLIMLFHAGVDLGLPSPYHCIPSGLRNVLDAFPGSKIVAAHMGGYRYWNDVEKYLLGREIYLDTSFSFNDLGSKAMEMLVKGHGVEKILFGTDSPWRDQSREVANIKAMNLSGEETDLILGGNAKCLLKL